MLCCPGVMYMDKECFIKATLEHHLPNIGNEVTQALYFLPDIPGKTLDFISL